MTNNRGPRLGGRWGVPLAAGFAILQVCCGSDTAGPNETFSQTQTSTVNNVAVLDGAVFSFTATRNGTADVEVNWNNGGNDIDIFATGGSCPNLASVINGDCQIIVSEESSTLKPERFSFGVSDGGSYKVWALNFGPGVESITFRITVR